MRHLLALIFLLLPLAGIAQEVDDKGFLVNLLESGLSDAGRIIEINGFEGALSSQATIAQLRIGDDEGIWLEAEGLTLTWDRSALLSGIIDISALRAERIIIHRAPIAPPGLPTAQSVPFSLPELPVSINIAGLEVARIELDASLLGPTTAGMEITLQLTGEITLADGAGTARVTAIRIGAQDSAALGRFEIDAAYSNTSHVLALDIELEEAENGILATMLDLPGGPSTALSLRGTGPLSDYSAQMRLASGGQDRVTGSFGLLTRDNADGQPEHRARLELRGDITPLIAPQYGAFFGDDLHLNLLGGRLGDGAFELNTLSLSAEALQLTGSAAFAADGWPLALQLSGEMRGADGHPVLLPISGSATYADIATFELSYAADQGAAWEAKFNAAGFTQPGVDIATLVLSGAGIIEPASGAQLGLFTGDIRYAAAGLQLADRGLARALGTEINGQIGLSRQTDEALLIEALTLRGPGIELSGTGQIDGPENGLRSQVDLNLTAEDLARFSTLTGLALGGAAQMQITADYHPLDRAIALQLNGTTDDLQLGIAPVDPLLAGHGVLQLSAARDETGTRINNLLITTPALRASGEAALDNTSGDATFTLELADIALVLPQLSGPTQLTIAAHQPIGRPAELIISAALPGLNARFEGGYDPAAPRPITGMLNAQASDITIFSALVSQTLSGAIELELNGDAASDLSAFDLTLTGTGDNLAFGIAPLDGLFVGQTQLNGALRRAGADDPVIRLEPLELTTRAMQARLLAQLAANGAATAEFDFEIYDAASVQPGLTGPITAKGSAGRDQLGATTVNLTATGPGGALARIDLLQAEAAAPFTGTFSALVTDLTELSALAGRPISGGAMLGAEGSFAPDMAQLALALHGRTASPQLGIDALDALLAGSGSFEAQLSRLPTGPISLQAGRLDLPALSGTFSASLDSPTAQATFDLRLSSLAALSDLPDTGPVTLSGQAQIATDSTASAMLTAALSGAQLDLRLAQGPDRSGAVTAQLEVAAPQLSAFSQLIGQPLSGSAQLQADATVLLQGPQIELSFTGQTQALRAGPALLTPLTAGTGRLSGQLTMPAPGQFILRDLQIIFPNLRLSGDVTSSADNGQAAFSAHLANIGLIAPGFTGPAQADGSAMLTDGIWQFTVEADGPGGANALVAGSAAPTGTLNLTANGQVPLALLNGVIEPRRLQGQALFDLALNGRATVENLTGQLRIEDGAFIDPALAQRAHGITGSVDLAAGRAMLQIQGYLGSDDAPGQIALTGDVSLLPGYNARLSASATDVQMRDPNLYETRASAQLTIIGPLTGGAAISGQVQLGQVEIQVPSSAIGLLGELPVVRHLGAPQAVGQTLTRAGLSLAGTDTAQSNGGAGPVFPLDLTISAPARVFIRGRGLDAEMGGQLRLTGTTAQVIPVGGFSLIRGRLDILQQRFELTEGSATMEGDFIPYLHLAARTTAPTGIVISIVVDGPADAPVISFQSQPELPQDEILAQLIFGRDLSAISPLQAVQLAAAINTLAGHGGGGFLNDFRSGIGLDDLNIVTDDNGDAALQAGKYLSENVYADVIISGEQTEVTLNLDLSDRLTARGTVSSTGETRLGIYFEQDY